MSFLRVDELFRFCLILSCFISASGRVFAESPPVPGRFTIKRDIVYAHPEGKDLLLDAYVPEGKGPFPAVLIVHGGSWKSGNKTQLSGYAMRLAGRGFAAFAINYRLAPEFKHPSQINDCRAALRWIEEHADDYHVDADRIGAIGYSAGAHLVFLLATAGDQNSPDEVVPPWKPGQKTGRRLKAVVAGGSPCDFTVLEEDDRVLAHFLGGTKREVPELYITASPAFYLTEDDPPILFFHGTADELVTIRGPEMMVEKLRKKGVEASLWKVPGGNHITAATNLEAVQKSIEFLKNISNLKATGRQGGRTGHGSSSQNVLMTASWRDKEPIAGNRHDLYDPQHLGHCSWLRSDCSDLSYWPMGRIKRCERNPWSVGRRCRSRTTPPAQSRRRRSDAFNK